MPHLHTAGVSAIKGKGVRCMVMEDLALGAGHTEGFPRKSVQVFLLVPKYHPCFSNRPPFPWGLRLGSPIRSRLQWGPFQWVAPPGVLHRAAPSALGEGLRPDPGGVYLNLSTSFMVARSSESSAHWRFQRKGWISSSFVILCQDREERRAPWLSITSNLFLLFLQVLFWKIM